MEKRFPHDLPKKIVVSKYALGKSDPKYKILWEY